MSGKIEYLEKYSVAPSPSRDYYGLKVVRNEVILYLWRISHGPHKTPIVRAAKFTNFDHDKSLQDEILRVFGEHLLKHVGNIARGNKTTLLTLPKSLIERLVNYLTVNDIVKLSSLSRVANEIFDDNSVWETLCKKYRSLKGNKYDGRQIHTCNWKQQFKEEQMYASINEQKNPRARLTAKQGKAKLKKEESSRSGTASKPIAPAVSTVNVDAKKPSDVFPKKLIPNSAVKKSDIPLDGQLVDQQKSNFERKTSIVKTIQTVGQKNLKTMRGQVSQRTEPKRDSEKKVAASATSSELKFVKQQNKIRRAAIDSKISSSSMKMAESKANLVKPKTKTINGQKSVLDSGQGGQNNSRAKNKTKKVGQSKSTILNTDKVLVGNPYGVKDDTFNLADLIEASLKNIRSPRSVFDYDFSCLQIPKSCGDVKTRLEIRKDIDSFRGTKVNRPRATLDRLSEKSEPLTAKSIDSANKTDRSEASSFAGKYTKTCVNRTKKTAVSKKNNFTDVIDDRAEKFERYGIYDKFPNPRTTDSNEEKRLTLQRPLNRMDVLRSLGSSNLALEMTASGGNACSSVGKQYELRKTLENLRNERFNEDN